MKKLNVLQKVQKKPMDLSTTDNKQLAWMLQFRTTHEVLPAHVVNEVSEAARRLIALSDKLSETEFKLNELLSKVTEENMQPEVKL